MPHLQLSTSRTTPPARRRRLPAVAAVGAFALVAAGAAVAAPSAQAATVITVAASGSADVRTVQAAIDRVPKNNTQPVTISVAPGRYTGQIVVPPDKPHISIVGSSGNPSDVVIVASLSQKSGSAEQTATAFVRAPNTTMRGLTIQNDYDEARNGASQALALYAAGDRQVYRNVRLLGNQDTFLVYSGNASRQYRVYVVDSYIEGDVDFIYGDGTVVIDRSEIKSLSRGSTSNNGYIAAPSTFRSNPYGILITNSRLTSNAPANTVYLGRPWHPNGNPDNVGQVLIRESTLGAHIRTAQPWTDMGGFDWRNGGRFSEYRNTGPGATVNSNRPQLTEAQAASHTSARYLAGSDGWNPLVPAPGPTATATPTQTSTATPRPTATATTPAPTPTSTPTVTARCSARSALIYQAFGTYLTTITVENGPAAITGWTVSWAGGTVNQVWNATYGASGGSHVVRNAAGNGALAAGGTATVVVLGTGTPPASLTCRPA